MMFVKCTDTPTGPCLHISGSDWRVAEVAQELLSLGVAHDLSYQGDYRARLVVPVPAQTCRSAGAAQEARA